MNRCRLTSIVQTKSRGTVLIDSANTIDRGYETMVFRCDSEGRVESWLDLDCALYSTKEEMKVGHQEMVEKWFNK